MILFGRNSISARRIKNKPLGELLIEKGIINKEQLNKALTLQRKYHKDSGEDNGGRHKFSGEVLVELGFVDRETIFSAFASQYHQLPYLPLSNYKIDSATINLIPSYIVHRHRIVPVDKFPNVLTVATSNPLDTKAIEEVEVYCKCKVHLVISHPTEIDNAIEQYYSSDVEDNNSSF
jgi:hypothetical protein